MKKFWDRGQIGGRKSVRIEELDENIKKKKKNGVYVPYLDMIQKDLDLREE